MLRTAKKYKKRVKRAFSRNGLGHGMAMLAIGRSVRALGLLQAPVAERLVVSLTSYPPRIGKMHLVIQSLLNQSLQPRKIVLYLSLVEFPGRIVPEGLARLGNDRFEIRFVAENLRPYKKLLFALADFPGAWIATCDDDRLYPAHTLARLWEAAAANPRTIICTRARRMVVQEGRFAPYREWTQARSPEPSFWVLPIGGYGVLYPPGSLGPVVGDRDMIAELAPLNDDLWFKAMSLMQDVPCSMIGGDDAMPALQFPNNIPLTKLNLKGKGQDGAVGHVFARFGLSVDAIAAKEARLRAVPRNLIDP
jgi:hypothetical protein